MSARKALYVVGCGDPKTFARSATKSEVECFERAKLMLAACVEEIEAFDVIEREPESPEALKALAEATRKRRRLERGEES